MQLRASLFVLTSLGLATAEAAPEWVDGPAATITTFCGSDFEQKQTITKVGYVVDHAAQAPQLGQVVNVHVVVINQHCWPDKFRINLYPPFGARLHSTASTCEFFTNATRSEQPSACQVQADANGVVSLPASVFLDGKGVISGTTHSFVLTVPFVFDSPVDDGFLASVTSVDDQGLENWGTAWPVVDVKVPYQRTMTIGMMIPMIPILAQPTIPPYTHGEDLILVGSSRAGSALPVAFSNDNGSFTATNYSISEFDGWSRHANVTRLSGDFNHDGLMDIALVGGDGWQSIPVATSNGDGTFTVWNHPAAEFAGWAATINVKPVAGDFDADGYTDIALVGGPGWTSVPVAFSRGYVGFDVRNEYINFSPVYGFATWAAVPGVRPIVGDFDGNGRDDIALVSPIREWADIPVAYSQGNGTFTVILGNAAAMGNRCPTAKPFNCFYSWNFAGAVRDPNATVLATDFNKDGLMDLVLVGSASLGIRFALSYGNGTFLVKETHDAWFADIAKRPGVKASSGDFDADGWPDIVLTGGVGWNNFPVARNTGGHGTFTSSNRGVGEFGGWAGHPSARTIIGDFDGDGRDDLALTGVDGWTSIPVAFSTGTGFTITNLGTTRFPNWAGDPNATVFVGHVN